MRQVFVVAVLTILVVGLAMLGGAACYVFFVRDWAERFWLIDLDDFTPPAAGVHVGQGVLTARSIPLDDRIGSVTDIVEGELDGQPGPEIGAASGEGILLLDPAFRPKRFSAIVEYVNHISFVHNETDGTYAVYNRYSWSDDDNVAMFDLSGKQVWKFAGPSEVVMMRAGDLDGDRVPEFCIAYPDEDEENSTLILRDYAGAERWRRTVPYVWDVAVGTLGDGAQPVIVTREDVDHLVARSAAGDVVSDIVPTNNVTEFTPVAWPGAPGSLVLLGEGDESLVLFDTSGQVIQALDAPDFYIPDTLCGVPVSLGSDAHPYFAVLAGDAFYRYAQLFVYDAGGTLIYYEVLHEYCASLFARRPEGSTAEHLLVGGYNRLIDYSLTEPGATAPDRAPRSTGHGEAPPENAQTS